MTKATQANTKYNNKDAAGSETHMAVDDKMKRGYTPETMREGYGAASGVRPETAETGGRAKHPESEDGSLTPERKSNHIEDENAGLADN